MSRHSKFLLKTTIACGSGIAVAGSLLIVKMIFFPALSQESPFLLFLVATSLAAWLGGLIPGLIVTLASGAAVDFLLVPPIYQLLTGPSTWQTLLFFIEGVFISVSIGLLHRANHNEQRATALRDDLMATLAHDLRNFIGIVVGGAPLVKEMLPTATLRETGVGELLDAVERAGNGMRLLVNDLLDTAKIEATGLALDRKPVDIVTLAREVTEFLGSTARDRRLVVDVMNLAPAGAVIDADPERLRQVLTNLVGNALKFTAPGGTVTISIATALDAVRLSVADDGCGIAEQDLCHLFERFWQVDRPKSKAGTGLGLFIVKGIVDAHAGRIDVTSTVGKGSTFTISLPRRSVPKPRSIWTLAARHWRPGS